MKMHDYGSWCQINVMEYPLDEIYGNNQHIAQLHEEYVRTKHAPDLLARMNVLLDMYPKHPKPDTVVKIVTHYWSHNQPNKTFKLTLNHDNKELVWAGELAQL